MVDFKKQNFLFGDVVYLNATVEICGFEVDCEYGLLYRVKVQDQKRDKYVYAWVSEQFISKTPQQADKEVHNVSQYHE